MAQAVDLLRVALPESACRDCRRNQEVSRGSRFPPRAQQFSSRYWNGGLDFRPAVRQDWLALRRRRKIGLVVASAEASSSTEGAENEGDLGEATRLQRGAASILYDLKGSSIFLVGMMGSGKTTVGKIMAKAMGYMFFDSDEVIEQAAGVPISQIFEEDGEEAFRKAETEVLKQLSAMTRSIIATGGGAVMRKENWGAMKNGVVVWLNMPVQMLAERITKSGTESRPLLKGTAESDEEAFQQTCQKLSQILKERRDYYAEADVHIAVASLGFTDEELTPAVLAEQTMLGIAKRLRDSQVKGGG